jgi:hypothetical protein
MAARYCTVSFWWRNTGTNRDEYVDLGALRDSTTAVVIAYPGMFSSTQLDTPALDPKRKEYLKVHPGGPGE